MKKFIVALFVLASFSLANGASVKLTTSVSASVDKFGAGRPGLLFKFDLPAELQGAQIDLAYLRFKVQTDTSRKPLGFLVRPMLSSWTSGARLTALSDSSASPNHVDFGRVNFRRGIGQIEITQLVRAWFTPSGVEGQNGLANLGLLVYPADPGVSAPQLRSWPAGGVAELEIFYTAPAVESKK